MTAIQIAAVIVAVIAVIVIVALAAYWWRHRTLRNRFGPEYDRVAAERGRLAADRELHARERKHHHLELRPLDPEVRERYASQWRQVQARFVDEPDTAINSADELLTQLVADRGYPTEDYEEELEQLSVDHARTLSRYRDAHRVYLRHQRGEATTEELRQALVHYRALFAELLGEQPAEPAGRERESDQPGKAARK